MPKKKKEKEVGVITHYFSKINVGVVKITSGSLKVGDKIHIKGATTDFEQEVKSLQVDHQDVSEVKKGEEAGMKVDDRVREEDKVFKIVE